MHCLSVLLILTLFSVVDLVSGSQSVLRSLDVAPVLHFTLTRRGGNFAATEWIKDYVNFTYLTQELENTEDRFNLTRRVVKGNTLVREAKIDGAKGLDEGALMGKIADDGLWFVSCSTLTVQSAANPSSSASCANQGSRYAKIQIGEPPQEVEMDLNMLTADFYVVLTTSRIGTKYDDLFSQTISTSCSFVQ